MPSGAYEYVVEVSMPADAPPTHSADRSRVFYELTCLVDIPFGRSALQPAQYSTSNSIRASIPTKLDVQQDGKKYVTAEITKVGFKEKLDASLFKKPKLGSVLI